MVIGNGMIASRFEAYTKQEDFLVFASGVSNSKDNQSEHFQREFRLLEETLEKYPGKILVYFSTCSIEDPDLVKSPYVLHKQKIESYIQYHVPRYFLFRISNLAGMSNNPYTLLNYFIFAILKGQPITVWENAYRNIIGIDDMYAAVDAILKKGAPVKMPINVANPENYPVPYILDCIERHLQKKAIRNSTPKGANYKIDISFIQEWWENLQVKFDEDYLPMLLKKYYHSR